MRWTTGIGIAVGGVGGAIAALIGAPKAPAPLPPAPPPAQPAAPTAPEPAALDSGASTPPAAPSGSAPLPTLLAPSAATPATTPVAPAAVSVAVAASAPAPAPPTAVIAPPALAVPTTRDGLLKAELFCDQKKDFDECARAAAALETGSAGPADAEQAKRFRRIALTHLVAQCETGSPHACFVLAAKYRTGTELALKPTSAEALEKRGAELCRLGRTAPECPAP